MNRTGQSRSALPSIGTHNVTYSVVVHLYLIEDQPAAIRRQCIGNGVRCPP